MEYKFSVVMAVYNVEPFLREAIDSLIAQSIGFKNIQLILVDDGSKDRSGAICDEYAAAHPENIIVIHKENGGVSSARNMGLARAQGRYINFMDSDDKLTRKTLALVYRFFEENRDKTDVVSVPLKFFDAASDDHVLNYKFDGGTRVIDLEKEWKNIQMHCSSTFFKREAVNGILFDTRLKYAEDAKFVMYILQNKMTLGVVSEGCYLYRKRSIGELSALQKATKDANGYLPKIQYALEESFDFYNNITGRVPKFIQFTAMYDLQWIIRMQYFPQGVLSAEEEAEYRDRMTSLFQRIDDDVILAQDYIKNDRKLYVVRKKHGCNPVLRASVDGQEVWVGDKHITNISQCFFKVDFIRMNAGQCVVEGRASVFPIPGTNPTVVAEADGRAISCENLPMKEYEYALGEMVLTYYYFRVVCPFAQDREEVRIRIGVEIDGIKNWYEQYVFGCYSGLTEKFRNAYYAHGRWYVQYSFPGLVFRKANREINTWLELCYLRELLLGRRMRSLRGAFYRVSYHLLRMLKRKPLWLISDRESHAGDNGEAFFRYVRENHKEIDARFILLKESSSYSELGKIGKMVQADTVRRKLLSLLSDYIISSQADQINCRPLGQKDHPVRDIMADIRFIFLQHGITKDDISGWLKKPKKNIYGFITAARPEYESILNGKYQYTEKEVWLTGFPRFDRLTTDNEPRQITIMPTWRQYLMEAADSRTSTRELGYGFSSSNYFKFYDGLLNNDRLICAADKYGYRLAFFPHPLLQTHLDAFHKHDAVRFLGYETAYRDVYAESALVVTDYSSAVFDFAYLRRPVLYVQFDKDEFFGGEHTYTKGYFDYERDGFGEVEYDLDSIVDRMIEYMENGCRMKDLYRERADRFFAFSDKNNCQRVYERIMELENQPNDP